MKASLSFRCNWLELDFYLIIETEQGGCTFDFKIVKIDIKSGKANFNILNFRCFCSHIFLFGQYFIYLL
jgi:hypothetical protein